MVILMMSLVEVIVTEGWTSARVEPSLDSSSVQVESACLGVNPLIPVSSLLHWMKGSLSVYLRHCKKEAWSFLSAPLHWDQLVESVSFC